MDTFFTKQQEWEKQILEKEEARALEYRKSNENIMQTLINCLGIQPNVINYQTSMQYPTHIAHYTVPQMTVQPINPLDARGTSSQIF